jgi:serine phosphatase RsbU (regulator of sigma subunit)
MAGRYVPDGPDGTAIAGDFFDVLPLSDTRVVIAVGDVAGHGVDAFARMTWLRAATRAFAADEPSPAAVLHRLDRLYAGYEPEDIATLWIGMYDSRTGRLLYASAGHVPPVMSHADGPTVLLEEAGAPPLGTGEVARHVEVHEVLWPVGAVLVAYSDGLVERPDADLDDRLSVLCATVEGANDWTADDQTPSRLVDVTLAAMVPDVAAARDDICVLALRRSETWAT